MVRYAASKNEQESDEPMKLHRLDRKYRGHKLAVAIGHNKYQRTHNGEAAKIQPAPKRSS